MDTPRAQRRIVLYPLDSRCTMLTNWLWTPDQNSTPTLERQHLWVGFPRDLSCTGLEASFDLPIGHVVVETALDPQGNTWRTLAETVMHRSPVALSWTPTQINNLRIRISKPLAPRFPLAYTFRSLSLLGSVEEIRSLALPAHSVPSVPLTDVSSACVERLGGLPGLHRNERLGLCHESTQSNRVRKSCGPDASTYSSRLLQVGFSHRHACLTHLGWDANGASRAQHNLLVADHTGGAHPVVMREGLRLSSESCGGEISICGRQICYRDIRPVPELRLDYYYALSEHTLTLQIDWDCGRSFVSSEIAALRLPLDLYQTVSSVLAMPETCGPSGLITLPAIINAPNHGTMRLTASSDQGEPPIYARLTALRSRGELWLDLMPGVRPLPNGLLEMPAGKGSVTFSLQLRRIFPGGNDDQRGLFGWWQHPPNYSFAERDNVLAGIPHAWLYGLSFRPDLGRFANNAVADSAAGCASYYAEIAAYSPLLAPGLDPRQLLRFATEQLLRDQDSAAAYSDWRHFPTAASAPIDCAWLYLASSGDWRWGERFGDAIVCFCQRLLAQELGDSGLIYSVYSGIPEEPGYMSCSWCDSIRSGHLESYVNAHAYRTLERAGGMLDRLDHSDTANACRAMASRLRASYLPTFLDDDRKEIGQWVARDGRRFSFDSHMHLGAAITCGLVPNLLAHKLLRAYLQRLDRHGAETYSLGLPIFLRAVPAVCHNDWMGQGVEADGRDQLGIYMNGSLHTHQLYYLLQALYQTGFRERANAIMSALALSVRHGRLSGGLHSGLDWRHPVSGEPSGYEGLLAEQYHFLLAGLTGYLGCHLTLDGLFVPPQAGTRLQGLLAHIRRAPDRALDGHQS